MTRIPGRSHGTWGRTFPAICFQRIRRGGTIVGGYCLKVDHNILAFRISGKALRVFNAIRDVFTSDERCLVASRGDALRVTDGFPRSNIELPSMPRAPHDIPLGGGSQFAGPGRQYSLRHVAVVQTASLMGTPVCKCEIVSVDIENDDGSTSDLH